MTLTLTICVAVNVLSSKAALVLLLLLCHPRHCLQSASTGTAGTASTGTALTEHPPLLQLPHTARGDATLPRGHVQISPSKHFQKSSEIFQPLNPGAAPAGMKISASALPRVKRTKSQGGSGSVVPRICNCC